MLDSKLQNEPDGLLLINPSILFALELQNQKYTL